MATVVPTAKQVGVLVHRAGWNASELQLTLVSISQTDIDTL